MSNNFNKLINNDIVFFEASNYSIFAKTFKLSDFYGWLFKVFNNNRNVAPKTEIAQNFVREGTSCHVLQPGQNWKKGKIRIAIEFITDETESPLNDVRQGNNNHEE